MMNKLSIWLLVLAFAALGFGCSRDEAHQEPVLSTPVDASQTSHEAHEAHEAHSEHDGHALSTAAPTLEPGQLWATDEALRTAMQRIRAAVDQAALAQEQKRFTVKDAQALAVTVEENIAYMIANCKLDAKPDAALHVLIGRMLSVVSTLKQSTAPDGVAQLRAALHDYQTTFDHPGWSTLGGL